MSGSSWVFVTRSPNSSLRTPSAIDAIRKRAPRQAQLFCPSRDGFGLPICRNKSIALTVSLLFGASCPTTIFRGVRAIVVFAFKRQPIGTRMHVFVEQREVTPSFTHCDSSSTVAGIIGSFGVRATRRHRMPNAVKWISMKSMCSTIHRTTFRRASYTTFSAIASTTLRPPFEKRWCTRFDDVRAITQAFVNHPAGKIADSRCDKKAAKSLAGEIIQLRHRLNVTAQHVKVKVYCG